METDNLLADLLLIWEESWELGEDIPATRLCADKPDLVESLQLQIDRLKKMSWMTRDQDDHDSDQPEIDPILGQILTGRYRIESSIGQGGFGRVYGGAYLDLKAWKVFDHAINNLPLDN